MPPVSLDTDVPRLRREEVDNFDLARLRDTGHDGQIAKAQILRFYAENAVTDAISRAASQAQDGDNESEIRQAVSEIIDSKLEEMKLDTNKLLAKLAEENRKAIQAEGYAQLRSANPYVRSLGAYQLRSEQLSDFVKASALLNPAIAEKSLVAGEVKSRAEIIKDEIKWLKEQNLYNHAFGYRVRGFHPGQPVEYRYIIPSIYYGRAADSTSTLSAFVPVTYLVMMLDRLFEEATHRQYCRIIPVPDKTGYFPRLTGGLGKAQPRDEAGAVTTGNLTASSVAYSIHNYARGVLFNLELLAEARLAPDMIALYMRELGRSLAEREKYDLWFGNGSSTADPAGGGGTVDGWTKGLGIEEQVHVVTDDGDLVNFIMDARGKLGGKKRPSGWRSNAVWLFNGDVETSLSFRTYDDGRYIFPINSPIDTLYRRPVIYNEEVPDGEGALFVSNLFFIFVKQDAYRMRFSTEGKTLIEKNQAYMVAEHATDGMPASKAFTDKDTQVLVRIKGIGKKKK